MANALNRDQLFSFARSHRDEYEALLKQFVETPTVSCDPAHAEDIRKGVDLTVETLRRFGGKVNVYEVKNGNPTVHAKSPQGFHGQINTFANRSEEHTSELQSRL